MPSWKKVLTSNDGYFNTINNSTVNGSYNIIFNSASVLAQDSTGVGLKYTTTNGSLAAEGDIIAYSTSDEKLKKFVKPITSPIEKLSQINGVTFQWKIKNEKVHPHEGNDVGVIAQEVQKVLPEAVTIRDNGYLAVDYTRLVPLLIEVCKEQQKQIDELKSKIK